MTENARSEVEAAATLADVGDDPVAVGGGFACVLEEEGIPVACARGAYVAPRWAVLVCRSVATECIRPCLREGRSSPDLQAAVCAVCALGTARGVGALFACGDAGSAWTR